MGGVIYCMCWCKFFIRWSLYSNAVLDAAGQQEEIWRLHSLVLLEDVLLDLPQFFFKLVNQLEGLGLSEVFLAVVTQWNLRWKRWI